MKKIYLLTASIISCSCNIFSQSQGPNSPAYATFSANGCLSCPGSEWNNYNNIMMADGLTADIGLADFPMCFQTSCYYSRYLIATNFGFTIPAVATVTGVKAEMLRSTSASGGIADTIVQIFIPGTLGINHASALPWTSSPLNIIYGDSTDLWGLALPPDSVNQTGFGFRVMIRNSIASTSVAISSVDHIQVTVYYSLTTGVFSKTRTANNLSVFYNGKENSLALPGAGSEKIISVSVIDLTGREIYSSALPSSEQSKCFLPDLSPGIYFAVIQSEKNKSAVRFAVSK